LALEPRVPGEPHLAHAAGAQAADDLEGAQPPDGRLTRGGGHRRAARADPCASGIRIMGRGFYRAPRESARMADPGAAAELVGGRRDRVSGNGPSRCPRWCGTPAWDSATL